MYVCKKLQNNKHISDERSKDRSFSGFFVLKILSRDRVTRLGEFLPFGRLVSLGSFLNIKVAQMFGPRSKLIINYDKNGLGHTLGDF
jgi:hypothetical protein